MSTSLATLAPRAPFTFPKLGVSPGATFFAAATLVAGAVLIGQAVGPPRPGASSSPTGAAKDCGRRW
jgi:hypothetical protein